jgi:exodeoxyribonuclease VII small subunit
MPERTPKSQGGDQTFKEAYGVLQRHAQVLRDQEEPNIDDLLTIVSESVAAYKVCKQRIDAVEAALKAALVDADVAAGSPPEGARAALAPAPPGARSPHARPPVDATDTDGVIPF